MGKMPRQMLDALITQRGWKPYIKSQWIDLGLKRSGVIITFEDHEQFEYKCSHKTAKEILNLKEQQ